MTELTKEQENEVRKISQQSIQEIMSDKGNVAFLNNSIDKFLKELKEQNKECEPAALMMSGAIMGFTLCKLLVSAEGSGENGNT